MKFLLLLAVVVSTSTGAFAVTGQRSYEFTDSTRSRTLKTFVWYPAAENSTPERLTKGPFQPVMAARDAAIVKTPEKFPVVLLSHGSGGTADKMFWLTDSLVKKGFIVVAVNHVGNMTGDNTGKGLIEVWIRPTDLSFALDKVSALNEFKDRLDMSRVAAVGHSAGGTTALLLAGARFAKEKFGSPVPNCHGTKDPYLAVWCKEIDSLDMKAYSADTIAHDYSDKRVSLAVAFDPGFAKSFAPDSLAAIKDRVHIFVADKLFTPFDEINSKELVKILGPSVAEVVPDSIHMTFLQPCSAGVPKDDPELRELCANNEVKVGIQNNVAEKTATFLAPKKMK